jgi:hypothetical protein
MTQKPMKTCQNWEVGNLRLGYRKYIKNTYKTKLEETNTKITGR